MHRFSRRHDPTRGYLAVQVGSVQEVIEISQVGSGRVTTFSNLQGLTGRVGSGRVGLGRVGSGWVGSGRVGSGWVGLGRVGSGWVGSGPVGSGQPWPDPNRDK